MIGNEGYERPIDERVGGRVSGHSPNRILSSKERFENICARCPYKCYGDGNIDLNRCGLYEAYHSNMTGLRSMIQEKCIELFKWNRSEEESKIRGFGYNIGWDLAQKEWLNKGYATAYADAWVEKIMRHVETNKTLEPPLTINFIEIYNETIRKRNEAVRRKKQYEEKHRELSSLAA